MNNELDVFVESEVDPSDAALYCFLEAEYFGQDLIKPILSRYLLAGGADMDSRGWSVSAVYMAILCHADVVLSENKTGEEVADK